MASDEMLCKVARRFLNRIEIIAMEKKTCFLDSSQSFRVKNMQRWFNEKCTLIAGRYLT